MKKYNITFYEDGRQKNLTVEARTREEALKKAWSLTDAEDVYVSEVLDL